MDVIDLKPVHEKWLSFEDLLKLSEKERREIARYEMVLPKINLEIEDDLDEELNFGHIIAHLKKAVYSSEIRHAQK